MPQTTTQSPEDSTEQIQLNAMTTAKLINESVQVTRKSGNLVQQVFLSPDEITQLRSALTNNTTQQIQLNSLTTATPINDSIQVKRREGNLVTTLHLTPNDIDAISTLCSTTNTTT